MCAGVQVCLTLISSPVWVGENDLSGHCRLELVGKERQGNGRNGDAVSPTYHHIDIVLSVSVFVCAFALTVCQPAL